ncbi:BTB/POZ domain-containing protein POB1-like [Bidens hawaiensis]|uniref:BTB/POZ domain-containing protein POB1-like n=1 Tax=Bidens hawaiensis TaxID=980011 RepID=UPI00404A5E04
MGLDVRDVAFFVSSPVLAARSPFFRKLFSNGMRESAQRYVPLQINASEEAAFTELLKFMYSKKLTVTTAPEVLDVLIAADKFEVASCIRHCSRLLRTLPMTPESVRVYLDLPSTILTAKAFQPLTVAAKQFYAVHSKDITEFNDAILGLPLAAVEEIIASDDLRVFSEDMVYRFVLKWAKAHYPNEKEHREIIATRLAKFIRYPLMTRRKITQVLSCQEFDPEFAKKVVNEALSFKAEIPNTQHRCTRHQNSIINRWFVERVYQSLPIKMVEFEHPSPRRVVYFDLTRDVCARLFPSGGVGSELFNLGTRDHQWFLLTARCANAESFGFHICMDQGDKELVPFAFNYEFAARCKGSSEFVSVYGGCYTFKHKKGIGTRNLFGVPWTEFIGDVSDFFVDGVLHLRAEVSEFSTTINRCEKLTISNLFGAM